jgi:hypothetical protein
MVWDLEIRLKMGMVYETKKLQLTHWALSLVYEIYLITPFDPSHITEGA